MKRLLVYIIMVLYVNSYMFFPVVDDINAYDEYGAVIDEVNSVIEYVDQEVLHHADNTPDDDNEEQHFHVMKYHPVVVQYLVTEPVSEGPRFHYESPRQYAVMGDQKATYRAYDVVAPPPKA